MRNKENIFPTVFIFYPVTSYWGHIFKLEHSLVDLKSVNLEVEFILKSFYVFELYIIPYKNFPTKFNEANKINITPLWVYKFIFVG